MPVLEIGSARIFWEQTGYAGDPMVLVHGSWGDHHNWDRVVPDLGRHFRLITYDRRGHSRSEGPAGQGSIHEDAADLAVLIERLDLAPAHIVGNSGGGAIVLRLAVERPDLFRTLVVHEPPLFGLLADLPEARAGLEEVQHRIAAVVTLLEAGDAEAGARRFVETIAFGPGAWEQLSAEARRTFVANAHTFLDETRDPEGLEVDLAALARFPHPALLSHGTTSAPFFPVVVDRIAQALPRAEKVVLEAAGHVPHLSHPDLYVEMIREFIERCFPVPVGVPQ